MRRTILLADDSVTIRKIVELTFGETDIRVESVGSGREALLRLDELHPDLVLADVVMPGPSGYDVCRAIKESDRPVPVLLLAGTFEPFDADMARACGSDGHVTKPFDARMLIDRVERLLERRHETPPPGAPAMRAEDDDLEAMFDDLATPESAGMTDAPPLVAPGERVPPPVDRAEAPRASTMSEADIEAIARVVVLRLSERVLREIAWDVVPDLAEIIVRERIRDLERDDRESS
jgi:CheY-like chemotaxis protein